MAPIPSTRSTGPDLRASPLARFFLVAYVLLVAYASLYPLAGWRTPPGPALAFLSAPWPRYVTGFDVAANFLGYVPYGLLAALASRPPLGRAGAALVALLTAVVLSIAMEAAQGFLPVRIPSNVDVLANAAGALCGGVAGAWLAPRLLGDGPLRRMRAAALDAGPAADLGLTLLGLWLFAQLNPATLLFGSGDLRDLVAGPPPAGEKHGAELFVTIEAATAAANLTAVSLLVSALTRAGVGAGRLVVALVALALLIKTGASAILMQAEHILAWLTPGAQIGLLAGTLASAAALRMPRAARIAFAAVLLMGATVLVNLSPPNPYLAATLKVWEQGHFLNFNGLTRLVSAAWPFAALAWLVWLAAARREPSS